MNAKPTLFQKREWVSLSKKFSPSVGTFRIIREAVRAISRAKQLLGTTTDTIAEISQQVGYTSSSSFSTTFKRYEAITPREYRDRFRMNH